jgi:hypothetical protein
VPLVPEAQHAVDAADEPAHRRLARARVAHEHEVAGERRGREAGFVAQAFYAEELGLAVDLLFDAVQSGEGVEVFEQFNTEFLTGTELEALPAVKDMHGARWPDTFQGEWPGFYLEYRIDCFLRHGAYTDRVQFQKDKKVGRFDYDLVLAAEGVPEFYGDLKSSDVTKRESPGNDAEDITRCVAEFGRFWYVLYEHETRHARDHGDVATIAWNEWKRSVGFTNGKPYNALSYARRFKQSVRYVKMKVLEINEANFPQVVSRLEQIRAAQPAPGQEPENGGEPTVPGLQETPAVPDPALPAEPVAPAGSR